MAFCTALSEAPVLQFITPSWTHSIKYSYWSARATVCLTFTSMTAQLHQRKSLWRMRKNLETWGKVWLTLAETWNDFKLEDKILQCLRCKQMCHCIPVTLKAGILLKVKQSPDDVNKSSYYWLYSVKSQLLNVHLEVQQLKAFTVSPYILPANRKTAEDPQLKYWHSLNLSLYLTALSL